MVSISRISSLEISRIFTIHSFAYFFIYTTKILYWTPHVGIILNINSNVQYFRRYFSVPGPLFALSTVTYSVYTWPCMYSYVSSSMYTCVGNLSPAMGARNQVGIGLSYRLASLCSLATQFPTPFLESIPRPIAQLKFLTLYTSVAFSCIVPWPVPATHLRISAIPAHEYEYIHALPILYIRVIKIHMRIKKCM
jgi:hypothetical protein